jgi:hypothetical protein
MSRSYTSFPLNASMACSRTAYLCNNYHHGAEFFLRIQYTLSQLKNLPSFMEPESSLLCSKELVTDPSPEPMDVIYSSQFESLLEETCPN